MVVRNKGIKLSAHQIKTKYENNTANSYTMSWNTIRRSNRVSCTCNKTSPLNIYLYLCFVNICEKVRLSKQELQSLPIIQPTLLILQPSLTSLPNLLVIQPSLPVRYFRYYIISLLFTDQILIQFWMIKAQQFHGILRSLKKPLTKCSLRQGNIQEETEIYCDFFTRFGDSSKELN